MVEFITSRFRYKTFSVASFKILSRPQSLAFSCLLVATCCLPAAAQFKTELVNDEGATAPCVGIGPIGGPAAKKCAELFEQAGFLKSDEVGISGLVVGVSEKDDGVITHVEPGSPGSQAGLAVGDVILAIDGKAVKPTPGTVATQLMFGKKDEELHFRVRRQSSEKEISLVRSQAAAPPNAPKSPNFFVAVKPLMDWRGRFVPCLGIGPAAMAAIAYCDSHFKPFGFIKVGDRGSTGLELDQDRAVITMIEAGSPAAKADLQVGDEIIAVNGKSLNGSAGESATQRLFGKAADQLHITIHRGQEDKTVVLNLGAKPK